MRMGACMSGYVADVQCAEQNDSETILSPWIALYGKNKL